MRPVITCALSFLVSSAVVAQDGASQARARTMGLVGIEEASATSADGVPIHFTHGGRGETTLVFIHGWSCDAGYWREQIGVLGRRCRVVAVDLAGHGSSGSDRKRFTMTAFGEDVRAVVDTVKAEKVVLVGHSMGGAVMLEAARLLGDRVVLLVGVDTLQDIEDEGTKEQLDQFLTGMRADFKGFVDGFVRSSFPRDASKALVERIVADMASAPPSVAISAFSEVWSYDGKAALRTVSVPVVCINSTMRPTKVEANRKYAKDYSVVLMDGVGHFLMQERPAEFNKQLEKVLQERGL
jgi:pimeloyl-ACP methyl ester carboxylesterase